MKGLFMKKGNDVHINVDVFNPPALTEEQKAELALLATMRDDEIDFSDIPSSQLGEWDNAVRGRFYKPIKKQMTIRIDVDVLEWLKTLGKGYQTRLNAILREAMLHNLLHKKESDKHPEHETIG
jgi:uncharacterized protein (DUF4415 family)